MPSTAPSDAAVAAYCDQLPIHRLQALGDADPREMALAVAALQPPGLLDHHRGTVHPGTAQLTHPA
jgi:hypothetical protein